MNRTEAEDAVIAKSKPTREHIEPAKNWLVKQNGEEGVLELERAWLKAENASVAQHNKYLLPENGQIEAQIESYRAARIGGHVLRVPSEFVASATTGREIPQPPVLFSRRVRKSDVSGNAASACTVYIEYNRLVTGDREAAACCNYLRVAKICRTLRPPLPFM